LVQAPAQWVSAVAAAAFAAGAGTNTVAAPLFGIPGTVLRYLTTGIVGIDGLAGPLG
jgi:hypothetical protein